MEIKVFRALWGMTEKHIGDILKRIEDAGYDGLETGAPYDDRLRDEWKEALSNSHLEFIGQMWTRTDVSGRLKKEGWALNLEQQIESTRTQVGINADMNPLYIDCQLGRDYLSFDDNCRIIEATQEAADEHGAEMRYETHRACFSFTPFIMRPFLEKYPWMRITLDASNWTCACESLLPEVEQQRDLDFAIERTDHIHARVGYEFGPQVSDPRAPENQHYVDLFMSWWKKVLDHHKARGTKTFYLTPEFGPAGYMHTQPFTNMPVTDNWTVNAYMKDIILERFGREY